MTDEKPIFLIGVPYDEGPQYGGPQHQYRFPSRPQNGAARQLAADKEGCPSAIVQCMPELLHLAHDDAQKRIDEMVEKEIHGTP